MTSARHLAIVGVTASGKSALALSVARKRDDVELVSVDSMQVYRCMDIGTAKPTQAERTEIRHHMIDLVEPSDEYTVARFAAEVREVLDDIEQRGKRAILVGGTGLYIRAAVEDLEVPGQFDEVRASLEADADTEELHRRLNDLDPVAASRMEPNNRRRVIRALEVTIGSGRPFSSFGPGLAEYRDIPTMMIGLTRSRGEIDRRLEQRFQEQLEGGFVEEVRDLAARPGGLSRTASQALGYKELLTHVRGETTLAEAGELTLARTRRFARRQDRWFRRDPRIRWLDANDACSETLSDLGW